MTLILANFLVMRRTVCWRAALCCRRSLVVPKMTTDHCPRPERTVAQGKTLAMHVQQIRNVRYEGDAYNYTTQESYSMRTCQLRKAIWQAQPSDVSAHAGGAGAGAIRAMSATRLQDTVLP